MNSQSSKYEFLSESIWQSLICTLLFILVGVAMYPVLFLGDTWDGVKGFLIASIPCYAFCYLGVSFGKDILRKPNLGGYLGGLVGILIYITVLTGLFIFFSGTIK